MKAIIVVNIDEGDLNRRNIPREYILEESLNVLASFYSHLKVGYDCGYDPTTITNGIEN